MNWWRENWFGFTLTVAVLVLCLSALYSRGEDKKPDPKPLTDTASVAVLKADGALKDAQLEMANLQQQWGQLQSQIQSIQERGTKAQAKLTEAQKADDAAVAEAAKAIGLDPAKYELDHSKLVFSPKAEPAKPTPSPEKK